MACPRSAPPGQPRRREPPTAEPDPRRWRVLVVCLVAGFMTLLDVSIVNVALPSIRAGLGAGENAVQWVVSGYALTFGLLLVPAGRVGDARGRRPTFMVGLAGFTRRQRGLRPGPVADAAGRRPADPGSRGRHPAAAGQRADPAAVQGRRAGPGLRGARRDHRHQHRGRAAARRRDHRGLRRRHRLADRLLRQRPGRHRRARAGRPADPAARRRTREAAGPRPGRGRPARARRHRAARAAHRAADLAQPAAARALPGRRGAVRPLVRLGAPLRPRAGHLGGRPGPVRAAVVLARRRRSACSTSPASPGSSSPTRCTCRRATCSTPRCSPGWP